MTAEPPGRKGDHFSRQPEGYRRYRPHYPPELFSYLASLAPSPGTVWDCGTGTGQATERLATHFRRVVGSDISRPQLAHAWSGPNVHYGAWSAEQCALADRSCDAITAGQALHWMDAAAFYAEVRRVAKPDAVVAVWCYGLFAIAPDIDDLVRRWVRETVGPYWPPERRLVDEGYRSLAFPFDERRAPALAMTARWSLDDLVGYVRTWSALPRYQRATGNDPIPALHAALRHRWGPLSGERRIRWPLTVRVGTAHG